MRYLLVEDNAQLATTVADRLASDGHAVDHAGDLAKAQAFVATTDYDLILLDIMLPDGDGRALLQRFRADNDNTPIIALTARSEISDRVSILDLGADDYIMKPFDFSELEARCRAVLRRRGGTAHSVVIIGNMQFDPMAGSLIVNGEQKELRNKEFRLLEILVAAPDTLFSKGRLVDRLFSYEEDVSENAIEVYVARLRKHLSGSGVSIETVRGMGYKLVSES